MRLLNSPLLGARVVALAVAATVSGQTTFEFDNKQVSAIRVGGTNLLTGGGSYLIGSSSGVDIPETNHYSYGSTDGKMTGGGPPFQLSYRKTAEGTLSVTAKVGPMPRPLNSLNLTFDFSTALISRLSFPSNTYRFQCTGRDGTRTGSSLQFDDIPQACPIYNKDGVLLGKVGAVVVDSANLGWIQFDGPLASVRINRTSSVGVRRVAFFNHFGAHAGQFEFGPVSQGATVSFEGQIAVTPSAAGFLSRFEAERDLQHQTGRAEADGWSANVLDASNRFLCYGPYTTSIPPGQRSAIFRLMLDNVSADNNQILTLDVFDAATNRTLARLPLTRKQFSRAFTYQDFTLGFTAATGQRLEFRTYWHGGSYVRQDRVEVR